MKPSAFISTGSLRNRVLDERREGGWIGDGEFAEHLSVDLDALLVDLVHEIAVANAVLAAGGADSDDPELSEITLLLSAVAEGVLPRLHHLFVSALEDVLFPAKIAGRLRDDLLVALVAHKATFNSSHNSPRLEWSTGSQPKGGSGRVVLDQRPKLSDVKEREDA